MSKFDLKKIDFIKGTQEFYQLTIDDDPDFSNMREDENREDRKTGVLDEFEKSLNETERKKLKSIYAIMERVANNQHVDGTKYHELMERPSSDPIKDFEFKKDKIRIYASQMPGGKILMLCGFKNSQSKDIKKFRKLKQRYFESVNKLP